MTCDNATHSHLEKEDAMLEKLAVFKLIFLGVIIEALPFILLGSFISSLIHELVSEEKVKKLLPKNPIIGILSASLIGLIFPVCECAIVPIVRRLMKKGVPIYMTIPLMVSVPIINPIVLFSTYVAFQGHPEILWLRAVLGLFVAWTLGFILYITRHKTKKHYLTSLYKHIHTIVAIHIHQLFR